ncbi:hypothetical protein [Vibrio parahaemolyticus]|uniref:hypothetical protein n=1 Tax=Vibrio parahaemolyticus TaxID=670 RepID=UPI0011242A8C|nr:hypothetical protein [Vibrio parahaemolyticus]TOJ23201.1 hypothetical protein CGI44_10095 [Vibrio parahaemolyticus]TOJ57190.1 hypothetical protein CGI37_10540 [Vibrio parahaemolyticus]HDY7676949.1 hypothetical protein [Vibrio vulnificus]
MLSFGDLKGLLEVNRVLVIPFAVLAYLKEFGFSQFPEVVVTPSFLMVISFVLVVVLASGFVSLVFGLILWGDRVIWKLFPNDFSPVFKLVMTSLISFGLLGFFKPEPFAQLDSVWFLASGAYGLYMLDVERKTQQMLKQR